MYSDYHNIDIIIIDLRQLFCFGLCRFCKDFISYEFKNICISIQEIKEKIFL